jgi:protoporphyrin/coproporphyrin ferrochelatase
MGINHTPPVGVLLMAYGSPDHLDEMEEYLLDVRGGRQTPAHLVEEIRSRYALIGGRSPLFDLTRKQAQALETELNTRAGSPCYHTYVGMRHWTPRIQTAVEEMQADGIQEAVAIVMAPHSSRLSTGAYFNRLQEALDVLNSPIAFTGIESWHNHPGLIAALAERTQDAKHKFPSHNPYIVFSAHSLPERILADGDPYAQQLLETASLVAQELNLPEGRWRFSFQSAGQNGETWLGPAIEETISALAAQDEKEILVVPVGFLCDHVEILYDLDIAAKQQAAGLGLHLERSESLNVLSTFINALADLTQTYTQSNSKGRAIHAHSLHRSES